MLIKTLIILTFSYSLSFGQEESTLNNDANKTAGEDIIEYVDDFRKSFHYQIGGAFLGFYGTSNPYENKFGKKILFSIYGLWSTIIWIIYTLYWT